MPQNMQLTHPIFKILSVIAAEKGLEIYVIGGYVRDLILKRPSKDIDIVVLGSGIELAETAAKQLGNLTVSVFKNRSICSDEILTRLGSMIRPRNWLREFFRTQMTPKAAAES